MIIGQGLSQREQWAAENIVYGGTIGWRIIAARNLQHQSHQAVVAPDIWNNLLAVAEEVDQAILRTGPGCQVMCRLDPDLYQRFHDAVQQARHVCGG